MLPHVLVYEQPKPYGLNIGLSTNQRIFFSPRDNRIFLFYNIVLQESESIELGSAIFRKNPLTPLLVPLVWPGARAHPLVHGLKNIAALFVLAQQILTSMEIRVVNITVPGSVCALKPGVVYWCRKYFVERGRFFRFRRVFLFGHFFSPFVILSLNQGFFCSLCKEC